MGTQGVNGANNAQQLAALKAQYADLMLAGKTEEAGKLAQEIQGLQIQSQQKDEVNLGNTQQPATEADVEKQQASKAANKQQTETAKNNKYAGDVVGQLGTDKANRDLVFGMTDAVNSGNLKTAAQYYLKLEKAGVFEKEGIGKPPFMEQLSDEIDAARPEFEAKAAKAEKEASDRMVGQDAVRTINTREGLTEMKTQFEKMDEKKEVKEDLGINTNAGGIAKSNRKNAEHITRQLNLNTVYVEGQTYNIDGKEMTAKEALEHQKAQLGDDWDKKRPQAQVMSEKGFAVAQKLNDIGKEKGFPILNDDGSINIENAQALARGMVSVTGDKGDRTELETVAKELGVKTGDVKDFLKGLNIDYKKDKTWLAHTIGGVLGAGTTAAALTTNLMTGGTTSAITAAFSYVIPGNTHTTVDNFYEATDVTLPDGTIVQHDEQSWSSTTTTKDPDVVKNGEVEVPGQKPKKGVGDYLGALALGYSVYDLSTKGLKHVLNHDGTILEKGKTVADALEDPNCLKNRDWFAGKKTGNREIMQKIKDFEFDPELGLDADTQKHIKLALLEAQIEKGGKLNQRELTGVLAGLKALNEMELKKPKPEAVVEPEPIVEPEPVVNKKPYDYGIDKGKEDLPTYTVKRGDAPAGMIQAFYGVPYSKNPNSPFQKLYKAWAEANNYHQGDNLKVGRKMVFPEIQVGDKTYVAGDMSKETYKTTVGKNNRPLDKGEASRYDRDTFTAYETQEEQRTWTGEKRYDKDTAQSDIDKQKQKRKEEEE
ncbi:hypothetical protein HDR58_06705 [bacterium]|nr:hypothetical protein [bacterium]